MYCQSRFVAASIITVLFLFANAANSYECPLTPIPKSYKPRGEIRKLSANAAIVIGKNASVPEKYAASQFQKQIKTRFGLSLEIKNEGEVAKDSQMIILGQVNTNSFLARLLKQNKIALDSNNPGFDGFVIEVLKDGSVLIGGSNARGVTYGQSAFFDLLSASGKNVVFSAVSIRDWPSIAWRGRPCSQMDLHDPASLDACVHARINWIDIRDVNTPSREATFGYLPGEPINTVLAAQVINDAHQRGIYVYGTVSCGVKPEKFDAVIKTFEQLITLKVDGLWISFDDPGPGQGADTLVSRIIELGKKHGMTGKDIAITPPSGSYQEIETSWNRTVAKAPGAGQMEWFFTRTPYARDIEVAKNIGIKTLPGWWHNWPRPAGGLTHDMAGGRALYQTKWAWAYYEMLPLSAGWDTPSYDELRHADRYTDNVMLWQTCPAEYVCHVLGYWAWDPNSHDWDRVRRATYSYVFGADQAQAAQQFDTDLAELKKLFVVPKYKDWTPAVWPSHLKKIEDRPAALALLDGMDSAWKKIEKGSPAQAMIGTDRLNDMFIAQMRDTIIIGRKMATLEFPQYSYPDFEQEMIKLVQTSDSAATARLAAVRPVIQKQVDDISAQLSMLKHIDAYREYWSDCLSGAAYWKEQARKQAEEKAESQKKKIEALSLFKEMAGGNYDSMLANLKQEAPGKVLFEITPAEWFEGNHRTKGTWGMGLYKSDRYEAMALALTGDRQSKEGDLADVWTKFTVPDYKGRLMMQVYIAHKVISAGVNPMHDVRLSVLMLDRKTLWNQDMASPLSDWVTLDITDVAKPGDTLNLRARAITKLNVKGYETITLFGPARFYEKQ